MFREAQMATKYKDEGTGTNVRYGMGWAHNCAWDVDCTLATAMPDSCTPSDTCKPNDFKGYYGTAFPGKLWDEDGGFDFLKKGTKVPLFIDGVNKDR